MSTIALKPLYDGFEAVQSLQMDRFGQVLIVALLLGVLVGCQQRRKLFPEGSYGSQYQRYEHTHGRQRQMTRTTVYGREVPNVSEQLKPLQGP